MLSSDKKKKKKNAVTGKKKTLRGGEKKSSPVWQSPTLSRGGKGNHRVRKKGEEVQPTLRRGEPFFQKGKKNLWGIPCPRGGANGERKKGHPILEPTPSGKGGRIPSFFREKKKKGFHFGKNWTRRRRRTGRANTKERKRPLSSSKASEHQKGKGVLKKKKRTNAFSLLRKKRRGGRPIQQKGSCE